LFPQKYAFLSIPIRTRIGYDLCNASFVWSFGNYAIVIPVRNPIALRQGLAPMQCRGSIGGGQIVRIYGFDWKAYSGLVMPAFSRWLVDGDETTLKRLFEHTRCAREEQFIPAAMQSSCTWPRAQALVKQLHHSEPVDKEYHLLCSAEQFTAQSDSYVHRHPPQLHIPADAIRIIWGTILEEYCLSWLTLDTKPEEETIDLDSAPQQKRDQIELDLHLSSAGFHELAQAMRENDSESLAQDVISSDDGEENDSSSTAHRGIEIGRHPMTLHLRGWLATHSVRAMALFELLACGRRRMPFGSLAGEMYQSYGGYLTPDEVLQLAVCLRHEIPPDPVEAAIDYKRFRHQQEEPQHEFRMIDEVMPIYADVFMMAVHIAAQHGLGLICSYETPLIA
jgi:hypothetical protein